MSSSDTKPRRIVVAMSGGVDSSVVAGVLKKQGHEVIGITLQLYDHGAATSKAGSCCAGQDIHDARRVAEKLDIPHYVLDYEARFKEKVIDTFAASYAAGETPIPCVACNQNIKFLDLLDTVQELGADALATGHYVERRDTAAGPALHRGADPARDQSYFLYATTKAQLAQLWFPLGAELKPNVREIAEDMGLPVAKKSDSQDICFVPTGSYARIVEKLRPDAANPGTIEHIDGRILGEHQGIIHYTVGQRRGLGIADSAPLYVVALDAPGRRVIVGPREALLTNKLELRDVNWLGDEGLAELVGSTREVYARVRSSQSPQLAELNVDNSGTVSVTLIDGDHGVSKGQACVFYDHGDARARVLGGGTINATANTFVTAGPTRINDMNAYIT
ncbi:MAG: tRNA-specific 2-thiouridylase [Hyphomicrobiaceae bacterium]|jgi:tRNA-specific 2-thiouridylase